ncbi:Abi-alpha family protein [Marinirhabdus gelatinilytica]|uniref:Uncharacterized protein DUF4393 n=1 Tax=Marinirhabdus gelatinilytica TaxID=1703343 RepID=A0A370Q8H7_9FLAO|nr:Abi-alpha family protein [Marinirhabdus gelatinilytica]RDK84655.1 uncharacterized protein DUF4393 [Marinirhabdus gelatinilytica]
MSENQLNLKSSTLEKGLDLAKEFLNKLMGPSVEEVGLLVSDNIRVWRFKNQIRLLNNVEKYIKKKKIKPKKVPLKILLPLLENASLEEEPLLNEMWENLLINYIDSSKNLNSIIFPKILSQLSTEDVIVLKKIRKFCNTLISVGNKNHIKIPTSNISGYSLDRPFNIEELSNLIRLNILKEIIQFNHSAFIILSSGRLEPQEEVITDDTIVLTEFGEKFIKACYTR